MRGHGRHDVDGVGRSRAGHRGSRASVRASGCTSTRRMPGSAMVCPELRWAFEGVDRADSLVVNPTSGCSCRSTARCCGAAGRRRSAPPSASFPSTSGHTGRGRLDRRLRPRARAKVPLAQALGRAALLRAGGPAAAHSRARAAGGAVRGLGAGGAWLGDLGAAALLARLLPPGRVGRGERAAGRARERDAASSSSRTRSSAGATCCGWPSGRSGRVRTTCGSRGTCCDARPPLCEPGTQLARFLDPQVGFPQYAECGRRRGVAPELRRR